ncbi:damage-control phosphatase ARMT1-like isoform X1 [Amphibalanus amphitrite]|uniref:damage-control phosphatase ARMT1-like isoform X1 n=2 Tax=Amphibalanus amphitrite TaxID=1232801 RepID=UPI001C9222F3|nr:damage-control phosphatase ARMT1-like isoform X1 [Amphibalanus amphitrite]
MGKLMNSGFCSGTLALLYFLLSTMGGQANTELPDVLRGSYKGSFAYKTISERMPVILTKVIDLFHREKINIENQYGDAAKEKLKQINGSLSELKSTMQRNKPLQPLAGAGADVPLWNRLLEEQWVDGEPPVWFDAPWLFVECYMYRRVREILENSGELRDYDYFGQQKRDTLEASMAAIELLGEHLLEMVADPAALSGQQVKRAFSDFIGMSLWANKNDLSISAGAHVSQEASPLVQLVELNHRVLVNDSEQVFAQLRRLRDKRDVRIDIVMDNAGFELFSDLCLADLLTSLGIAQRMSFHIKAHPWYVSDTTPADVRHTLQHMQSAEGKPALRRLAERWQGYLDAGTWVFETDTFWTSPLPFSRMASEAPELYAHLQGADMIIFKGDLNYRKLLGDRNWPHSTGFCASLEGFHPAPLMALRTMKADLVSGLAPEREALTAGDPSWMVSGEWALIQLCECTDTARGGDEL